MNPLTHVGWRIAGGSPLGTSSVRTNDDTIPPPLDVLLDVRNHERLRVQIVDRNVEKPLDLTGVQVHGDDMVTPGYGEHVSHQLRRNWGPRLVLLVHPCVRETGDHSGDSPCGCPLASRSEDEEFHEIIVNIA